MKTGLDGIFLLPFETGDATLQFPFAWSEADAAHVLFRQDLTHDIRPANLPQEEVVCRVVAPHQGAFQQVTEGRRKAIRSQDQRPDRLVEQRQIFFPESDFLRQIELTPIDEVKRRDGNP